MFYHKQFSKTFKWSNNNIQKLIFYLVKIYKKKEAVVEVEEAKANQCIILKLIKEDLNLNLKAQKEDQNPNPNLKKEAVFIKETFWMSHSIL